MLGGNLISAIFMWFITLYLVRTDHLQELGILSLVQSLGLLFFVFFTFKLLNVQITDTHEKFTQSDYYFARLISCVFLTLLSAIYIYFLNYENYIKLAFIFYIFYYCVMIFREYFSAHYQKQQDYQKVFLSNSLTGFLSFTSFIICFELSNNITYAIASMFFAVLLGLSLDHCFIVKYLKKIYAHFNLKSCFALIKEHFFLGLSAVFVSTLILVPRFFIENYQGLKALGVFSALTSIMFFVNIFLNSVTQVLLKDISDIYNKNKKLAYKNMVTKFFMISLMISLGLIPFFFMKDYVAVLVFGQEFSIYSHELFYAVFMALFLFWFNYGNFILTVQRNFSVQIYISIFAFLSQLIFCYFLVESYSYSGAFGSMAISYILGFLICVGVFIRKDFLLNKCNGRFK